jgi:hypothetical protein
VLTYLPRSKFWDISEVTLHYYNTIKQAMHELHYSVAASLSTVKPGYNDIGVCVTLSIASDICGNN